MKDNLRERLMEIHLKLLKASNHQDAPLSIDLEEITDICEFMNTFLYD